MAKIILRDRLNITKEKYQSLIKFDSCKFSVKPKKCCIDCKSKLCGTNKTKECRICKNKKFTSTGFNCCKIEE